MGLWSNSGASHIPMEEKEGMFVYGYQGLSASPGQGLGQLSSLIKTLRCPLCNFCRFNLSRECNKSDWGLAVVETFTGGAL